MRKWEIKNAVVAQQWPQQFDIVLRIRGILLIRTIESICEEICELN